MNANELYQKINYIGMEKSARRILIKEKLKKADEVAMMTSLEVFERLLETYEVVACEKEKIAIVKQDDMKIYNSITKFLSR